MSDPGQKSPTERVLDVTVYAPLGLALTVAESFPHFVRKGRSRLGAQIGLARTVGQFAVRQGYRQFRGMAMPRPPFPFWPSGGQSGADRAGPSNGASTRTTPGAPTANGAGPASDRPTRPAAPGPTSAATRVGGAGREGVAAAHLAIPSYDSLSASQVVQRLAGLSRDEIEAVRAYEAATRGRRTVLARAEQLLA